MINEEEDTFGILPYNDPVHGILHAKVLKSTKAAALVAENLVPRCNIQYKPLWEILCCDLGIHLPPLKSIDDQDYQPGVFSNPLAFHTLKQPNSKDHMPSDDELAGYFSEVSKGFCIWLMKAFL